MRPALCQPDGGAAPIPVAEPVTIATLPVRFACSIGRAAPMLPLMTLAAPAAANNESGKPIRIVLIRHGQPAIDPAPKTGHGGFRDYIDAYEASGLDPASAPPGELQDLVRELSEVFTSGRKRADESAKALAPGAELIADPLFRRSPRWPRRESRCSG